MIDETKKLFQEIKKELEDLRFRRVFQQDIVPQAVKQRHMGEPNAYISAGLVANRPDPAEVTSGVSAYYGLDTKKLYVWNVDNNEWDEVQLA